MTLTVGALKSRLRLMPKECELQAHIPHGVDGSQDRTVPLAKCHHHNQDENFVDYEQPVEIFIGEKPMKISGLLRRLDKFPDESLVRVAVPGDGHHRCLGIDLIGFASGTDTDTPPVELRTEDWEATRNGQAFVIRLDDHTHHKKGGKAETGDWTYTAGGVRRRIEEVELETRPKDDNRAAPRTEE
jgi:hypothetical protein